MKHRMIKLLVAAGFTVALAASAFWIFMTYWVREERARGLERDISAFAATHGDRLPYNWKEFLAFVNEPQGGPWSESQLQQFAALRWGHEMRYPAADGKYIYIHDRHYQYLESELNKDFDRETGPPINP
jgi:hypothetical protein